MEKKKLLLVSVAVGLFLVIAIGASVLVFSPRDYHSVTRVETIPLTPAVAPGVSAIVPDVVDQTPPYGPVQSADSATNTAETAPVNERSLENIIYITAEGSAEDAVRVERLNDGNTKTYITIPAPRESVAVAAPEPAPVAAPVQEKPATASKSAAPAKTESVRGNPSWWVQTNSYSKKAYADDAKKFLETKGITSVVTNGNVGGKTYYRVRVGPYSSQAEADYWLSLIKSIEGMENSLVWKSSNL